jgi:hydroxymethylglutaryl-CoA lyase
MPQLPGHVALVESGPRNTLPHAPPLATEARVSLVERLVQAGLRDLVVAGGEDLTPLAPGSEGAPLLDRLPRHPEVRYSLIVDDLATLEDSLAAGPAEITVRADGTDAAARRRHGGDVEDGLRRLEPVALLAAEHGVRLRGQLTGVVHCPDAGPVGPHQVADLCGELLNLGCFEVSLGDRNGAGEVAGWLALWDLCAARIGPDRLAVRLRAGWSGALACLDALLPRGLQTVDTSVGGLGPDGLLGTEDVAAHLAALGVTTGVDRDLLVETAWWLGGHLGQAPLSRVSRAEGPHHRLAD